MALLIKRELKSSASAEAWLKHCYYWRLTSFSSRFLGGDIRGGRRTKRKK
jgi:hypothetical protein